MTFDEWWKTVSPSGLSPCDEQAARRGWDAGQIEALREAVKLMCADCNLDWTPKENGKHYPDLGERDCAAWPIHRMIAELIDE